MFYAFWYDADARETKRISLRTQDPAEAEARFAAFLVEGREIRAPRSGGLTVRRALTDYLEEHVYKNCAAGRRQEDAVRHLTSFFGDTPLEAVDVLASRNYARARELGQIGGGSRRKDKRGSAPTVRRELNVLVAAANHAIWMKRTTPGWAVQVDLPSERRLGPDDEAPYYSREELARLFDMADALALDSDDYVGQEMPMFVRLLYWTGARRGSIEDLERDQVKVAAKRILLQKPGKRATKKRQPIVPILTPMEPVIADLLARSNRRRLFECVDFYRPYVALCAAAGIDEARRNPHTMRHTRATHLLQDGKSLYDVARLLGDTLATIERVYGHHSAEHLAANLE